MKERKYAYMKTYNPNGKIGIIYQWNAYYVSQILEGKNGALMITTIRKYKTLSGAEKFLLNRFNEEGFIPEISYGTESFIKKGEYWKG